MRRQTARHMLRDAPDFLTDLDSDLRGLVFFTLLGVYCVAGGFSGR
jgi:hypothetical protein